jgi:hypothetical protein
MEWRFGVGLKCYLCQRMKVNHNLRGMSMPISKLLCGFHFYVHWFIFLIGWWYTRPMPQFNSLQEIFDLAPDYFLPENANDIQGSVQFEFTGDGGGDWYLQVLNGQLAVIKGRLSQHDLYATASAQDSLDIANGKLNPMVAYFKGKVNVLGDTSKIFEFQKVFRLPEQLEWLRSIK